MLWTRQNYHRKHRQIWRRNSTSLCQGPTRSAICPFPTFNWLICSPCCTTSSLSWSARYILSALDFNGPIVVRLFILFHFTYVKGIGSRWQRTASAFQCVLRCATGDVVVVGRTVVSKGGKGVDDSTRRRRRDGD